MPGLVRLVPGIHVLSTASQSKDVDGRDKPDKPGHDENRFGARE
jgi:hypothetical protein